MTRQRRTATGTNPHLKLKNSIKRTKRLSKRLSTTDSSTLAEARPLDTISSIPASMCVSTQELVRTSSSSSCQNFQVGDPTPQNFTRALFLIMPSTRSKISAICHTTCHAIKQLFIGEGLDIASKEATCPKR